MSVGRFLMRGRLFQSRLFATRMLSNQNVAIPTRMAYLTGASQYRSAIEGASQYRSEITGTSQYRSVLEGASK